MSYVDEVIELVVKKNPDEPEFHQAVKEVLEDGLPEIGVYDFRFIVQRAAVAMVDSVGNDDVVAIGSQDAAADGLEFYLRRPAMIEQNDAFRFFTGRNDQTGDTLDTYLFFLNHFHKSSLFFN
mgnify:CR=1 FL=1